MWHPAERIRHTLPIAQWPSAHAAETSLLYSPLPLGSLTVAQRTWVPAMVPWRATEDGFVTDDVVDWYARFAKGKPGVLVVEATGIRDVPSGPLLRIGHERFIPGLQKLTDAVKEASQGETKVFIQVIDFLRINRRPAKEVFFARYLEISEQHRAGLSEVAAETDWATASEEQVRSALSAQNDETLQTILSEREMEDYRYGRRERVSDTHVPHIKELPQVLPELFSLAAQRAFTAGFDGVELHYAHAYTMASFLSALNTRDDGYGGSRENRVRLPREVLAAVRASVGRKAVVGLRFLGEDVVPGGSELADAAYFAGEFAKAGADYLSVSKGGKFEDAEQPKVGRAAYPYTGPSGYECMPTVYSDAQGPFARNVNLARTIKEHVNGLGFSIPIVTSGGICTFELAEQALQNGDADIVASARQTLADPDWFLKMRLGLGERIRRCEYTNYCEGLDQNHKQVTCKLWDRTQLDEPAVKLDVTGKRRLVAPSWSPKTP